jgi:hypothetical protein
MVIRLGRALPRASSDLPGSLACRAGAHRDCSRFLPYLVLLRVGFALPASSRTPRYVFCGTGRRPPLTAASRTLSGTLLYGVRTFLPGKPGRPSGPTTCTFIIDAWGIDRSRAERFSFGISRMSNFSGSETRNQERGTCCHWGGQDRVEELLAASDLILLGSRHVHRLRPRGRHGRRGRLRAARLALRHLLPVRRMVRPAIERMPLGGARSGGCQQHDEQEFLHDRELST